MREVQQIFQNFLLWLPLDQLPYNQGKISEIKDLFVQKNKVGIEV